MISDVSFGAWLRRRRRVLELTQEVLAERVGCSLATIRKIEVDERRPSPPMAERLADVLALTAGERSIFLKVARGERRVDQLPGFTHLAQLPTEPVAWRRGNLPVMPTPLLGRERELAEVARSLGNPQCRLLTLIGPGGVGKTRLAVAAAETQRPAFTDGVHFVALAPLRSAEFIVPAIAEAVGFTFYGAGDPKSQLLHYLRPKSLALVLDNAEHLLAGVDLFVDLLQHASEVKLLVTSREPLKLQGEWVFDVQGLPPPEHGQADPDANSAMALFVRRARQVKAEFDLAVERSAVVKICQLVEGLPLAIELAAAWVRVLACAEIAREIERNLDFLASPARDVPARHRSMRAAFDHSWKLLSEDERQVMSQLSSCRGGFSREAAGRVAGATLNLLSALVDKSLLHRTEAGRYDVHELVRQYSAEHLEQFGEGEAAHDRHLRFFLALAEEAQPHLLRAEQLDWLERLVAEQDNFRSALAWSLRGDRPPADVELNLRLAGALGWFWHLRGHWREGRDWLARALALEALPADEPGAQQAAVAQALYHAGRLALNQDDYAPAAAFFEKSLALCRALGDRWGQAYSLLNLSIIAFASSELAQARAHVEESLALFRAVQDRWGVAYALYQLGPIEIQQRGYPAAAPLYAESDRLRREIGERWSIASSLRTRGYWLYRQEDYPQAETLLEESIDLHQELGDRVGIAYSLRVLGLVAQSRGDTRQARALHEKSRALCEELGDKDGLFWALSGLGQVALDDGDVAEAGRLFADDLSLAREMENKMLIITALILRAAAARRAADYHTARSALVESLSWMHGPTLKTFAADVLNEFAGLAAAQGRAERAARLFGAAAATYAATGMSLPPSTRAEYERTVADARAQLDEAAFAAAWAEGQTLTLEQAIEYAL